MSSYFDARLNLYYNLRIHFDEIPELVPILSYHMFLRQKYGASAGLDNSTRARLIAANVFDSKDLLSFLLLISERVRTFEDVSTQSAVEAGRYYFEQYKAEAEYWHENAFRF